MKRRRIGLTTRHELLKGVKYLGVIKPNSNEQRNADEARKALETAIKDHSQYLLITISREEGSSGIQTIASGSMGFIYDAREVIDKILAGKGSDKPEPKTWGVN